MRFSEIVNEYQITPDPAWVDIPDSNGSNPMGIISVAGAKGTIKVLPFHGGVDFWVERESDDIAYAQIVSRGDYTMLKYAFVIPEFEGKGVMSELVHWIIRDRKVPLINDTQMSKSGEFFWKKLMMGFDSAVIDVKTGERFDLNQIGIDVMAPEKDNFNPDIYNPSDDTGQRFFYLLEAPQYFVHIIEGVAHRYSCSSDRHIYNKRSPGCIRYFHDGDI